MPTVFPCRVAKEISYSGDRECTISVAVSGDSADPDKDGFENLLEYVQALDPKTADAHLGPFSGKHDGYLTMTYRLNPKATDMNYSVQLGSDLVNWTTGSVFVGMTDFGTYRLMTVRDNVPINSNPRRFMRLKVEKP